MPDYYISFSFEIPNLTKDEKDWLDSLMRPKEDDEPTPLERLFENTGSDPEYPGFNLNTSGGKAWFYEEENGTPEDAATVVMAFLEGFRPDEAIGFEWSNSCSKPNLDAYGGGAVLITATKCHWLVTSQWLAEHPAWPK